MNHTMIIAVVLATASASAAAITPTGLLTSLAAEARQVDAGFLEFSAERGAAFYSAKHGGDWSCATCHTDKPGATGRHAVTNKIIQPLAPAANAERFTHPEKIEKWFKRNCNDVLKRACTPQEKGDLVAWLLTVKR